MAYPNVPLGKNEQDRRVSQAVNHLLNQVEYYVIQAEGQPDASQELFDQEFPLPVTLVASSCVLKLKDGTGVTPTNSAAFTLTVGGVTVGTGTLGAGQTTGNWQFTTTAIPEFTRVLLTAPTPQDATLANVVIAIAVQT